MKNPTNKGVGTGTAVVRNYDTLNSATSNFFKGLGDKVDKDNLKKEKDAIKKQAMVDQLSGKLGEYDPTKMRIADKDAALKMYNGIVNKYKGKYGEMLGGNPALTNEYNNDIARMKIFISDSASSVAGFAAERKAVFASDSGYSPEKQAEVMDYITSEGSTMDGYNKLGLGARDQVIGDPYKDMADKFQDSQSVFYTKVNDRASQTTGASGEISRTWIDDADALVKFENAMTPDDKQNMNLMFPDVPLKERPEAYYQKWKSFIKNNEIENIPGNYKTSPEGGKPRPKGEGLGLSNYSAATAAYDEDEYYNERKDGIIAEWDVILKDIDNIASVSKRDAKRRKAEADRKAQLDALKNNPVTKMLTLGKTTDGRSLPPRTMGGKTQVFSEFIFKKDGWYAIVNNYTDDNTGNPTIKGKTETVKVDKTLATHIKAAYNMNLDKLWNSVEAGKSGGGLTEKYNQK